ncbi:MAG: site-2 protease family protein [Acidimicrobiia bacterium]|nr:site-2 protease family protein [Acidimicrobiia bacterium]
MPDIAEFLLYMIVFLFSLSLHEAAHAWTAERFGDSTGRYLGRVTLNPLPHIDPLGTLVFPAIGFFTGGVMFGWAKPVPWNPRNVKDRRTADIWISAAGPISNVLALIGFLVLHKLFALYAASGLDVLGDTAVPLFRMCLIGIRLNVILAVFNLLPIPPLDGSWILPHFLPRALAQAYEQIRPYGFLILLVCLSLGVFRAVLLPVLQVVESVMDL